MCYWFANLYYLCTRMLLMVLNPTKILALTAGVVLVLLYLPGHQPYYTIPGSIIAKSYSNSMLAVLNSRIKPVSNNSGSSAPLWNEPTQPIGSTNSSARRSYGIVFRRDNETMVSFSSISNPTTTL